MADLREYWKGRDRAIAKLVSEQDQYVAAAEDAILNGKMDSAGWEEAFSLIDAMRESDDLPTFDRFVAMFAQIGYREVLRRIQV